MRSEGAPTGAHAPLTQTQARIVCDILDRVIPNADIRVFGSRATGRARPFSDLDLLVLRPACLSWEQLADLRDEFEASELPFRVDVVEASALAGGIAERAIGESISLREMTGGLGYRTTRPS